MYGVPQGQRMGERKKYYGGYAEKKMRFVTIERTAIKKWYRR